MFFAATGGRGVDSYNIISGAIRLDFRRDENRNQPDNGIDVNLATGTVNDDGFGNTEFITGAGRAREIRATDFNDTMIGSGFDDSFITRAGDDYVDGGLGFDRIRYDRNGAGSMNIDLQAQTASGKWEGNPFTDTLISIEWVRGSDQGVDFISGSTADERFEGRSGTDLLNGRGGDDELNGGADADVFIFEPGFGNDEIEDFEFGIDVISFNGFGFADAAGLLAAATFTFNGTDTQIAFNGTSDILIVRNFDLTPSSTLPQDVFTFNAITAAVGGGPLSGTSTNDFITGSDQTDDIMAGDGNDVIIGVGNAGTDRQMLDGGNGNDILIGSDDHEQFNGGDGNDIIHTGDNDTNLVDVTVGSRGDDQINFSGNYVGYQGVFYGDLSAAITVNLDSAANTGSVDKGINGTDTLIDIRMPIFADRGGLGISGTEFNDTFNIDKEDNGFLQVTGGRGSDTYNIISGRIRLDFRRDEDFNSPDNGIIINLATNTVDEDGFGNNDFITGAGRVGEVRGTEFNDIMIGSGLDDSFITQAGNDFVDGGLGFDRIRYDRDGASDMIINLQTQSATGMWDGIAFTDTLMSIELVRGSDTNDIITGTNLADELFGNGGDDTIFGNGNDNGGFEYLDGGDGNDTLIGSDGKESFNGGDGNDIIQTGGNDPNNGDFTRGSRGNDQIDFSGNLVGFQEVSYGDLSAAIIVNLDSTANTGTVNKGVNGTDTFIDILKPLMASTVPPGGGLGIDGTEFNDTFNIDLADEYYFRVTGGRGADSYNIISGQIGLDFQRDEDFNQPDNGIDINLATGTVNDDGFGNTEFITGAGRVREVRGTDFNDIIIGSDERESFYGGDGNDIIQTGGNDPNNGDYTEGSRGNDQIDFSGNLVGFQTVSYGNLSAAITLNLDSTVNIATVNKGGNGTDTWIDILKPLQSSLLPQGGGLEIIGTEFNDTFNIDLTNDLFLNVAGGRGADSYNIISGEIRLDFRRDENFNQPDNGIDINLATNTVNDDGFGNIESITGAGRVREVRGTDFNDIITGTNLADRLVGNGGNDTIIGGGNDNDGFEYLEGGDGDDTLIGSDGRDSFDGGDGNDIIQTGGDGTNSGDFTQGSRGNDQIDFTSNLGGYQTVSYGNLSAAVVVSLNSTTNTGSVDKGINGTDTLIDILKPLQPSDGGMGIRGTEFNDTFNIDLANGMFLEVTGGRGADSYNITSGEIKLSFWRDEDSNQPANGIDVNLATGAVNNDGFGNSESITGAGRVRQIEGTDFNDTIIGSGFDDRFITRGGDDVVDGGLGFDRVRYDRDGAGDININLQTQTATGTWDGNLFTDSLTSIEWVRGGDGADTMLGTTAAERFDGRDGNDVLEGGGGLDDYFGDNDDDTVIVTDLDFNYADGGSGQDSLVFQGGGQTLNFTLNSGPDTVSFERIDLGTADGSTTLIGHEQNIIDASDEANTAIAAILGNGDDALLIDGDGSDFLNLQNSGIIPSSNWQLDATDSGSYAGYNVYDYTDGLTTFARVVVDEDIAVILPV
ncbi:MAG: hypothetical protein GKR97_19310 [Rhizobiaceae bacterium]|nr:hypothetical protein [Rhizobiaceae bacterium]